jgi:hypothetical protein
VHANAGRTKTAFGNHYLRFYRCFRTGCHTRGIYQVNQRLKNYLGLTILNNPYAAFCVYVVLLREMKSRKNILFQVLFVTMLLIGVGLDVVSHVIAEPQATEITTTQQSDEEIQNFSDLDLFDDDNIYQRSDFSIYADQVGQKVALSDQSVKSEYTDTSWQPPQFS